MSYAKHFHDRNQTPQSEAADARQVPNSSGGFSFVLDLWGRLDRWLILGSEGGSYYAGERELTLENAATVKACLDADAPRAVARIVQISTSGRAPKNDPAVFALAMAAGHPAGSKHALEAVSKVCRTGTHLFQFVEAVQKFRGWGRALRGAVGSWYNDRTAEKLAIQVAKYGQRGGWSHRDLLRLSHPKASTPDHKAIYRWAIGVGPEERTVVRKVDGSTTHYLAVKPAPEYLRQFDRLKQLGETDSAEAIRLIREYGYTHEMVPSALKNRPAVWEALLSDMPPTAMIRNLAKMTAVGLLQPGGDAVKLVARKLGDTEALRSARVHPISVLLALKIYEAGHGEKGKLRWQPVRQVIDALDGAFYEAFHTIEPSGKRILLALDVSGSMGSPEIAGCPGITPRIAAGAMAMVTARTEGAWQCVAFTAGVSGEYRHPRCDSMHHGYPASISELSISPRQRLDDVVRSLQSLPMGGTNCALPMMYAKDRGLAIDVFHIYTDSETWHGKMHPHEALKTYRESTGISAKLAVVGMVANPFTIADPSDAGMLDVVGFDAASPAILADFAAGPRQDPYEPTRGRSAD